MNPKLINVMALWKHLSGVVSNLEHFPLTQQNENEIAYESKAKRKLKRATHKFSNEQNHKEKVTAKQLFELFYFFANRNK